MTFQNLISRIPKWNTQIVENEKKRICDKSGCNYLEDLISSNKIDDETMDELIERCGDDTADGECLFSEMLGDGYIEKARFDVDNRWYPSIDRNNFNEILNDRLDEI